MCFSGSLRTYKIKNKKTIFDYHHFIYVYFLPKKWNFRYIWSFLFHLWVKICKKGNLKLTIQKMQYNKKRALRNLEITHHRIPCIRSYSLEVSFGVGFVSILDDVFVTVISRSRAHTCSKILRSIIVYSDNA